MAIYFNPKKIERLEQYLKTPEIPAHEKIGAVFTQTLEAIRSGEQGKAAKLLSYLHVADDDKASQKTMLSLIQTLSDGSLRIVSASTGTYFLQKPLEDKKNQFENVAVFKIGRKRAAVETMARQLAHLLGLDKHMVPGMFCAAVNFPIAYPNSDDADETLQDVEETTEELWNGHEKVFLPSIEKSYDLSIKMLNIAEESFETESDESSEKITPAEKTATAVVGIIMPFLKKEPKASLYDYTLMTIFALAVGLRDGNSFEGSTFFDVEDCMPVRIDPPLASENMEKVLSAIDLPYLDKDPRTTEKLGSKEISELLNLVRRWDIHSVINTLKRLKFHYEDREAEPLLPKMKSIDEGGHHIKIEKTEPPHLINGALNHLLPSNTKRRLLLPKQLEACNTRLQRIRDHITHCARRGQTFTPQGLVYAVDLWGELYHAAIRTSKDLPKQYNRMIHMTGVNSISGRTLPEALRVSLPELNSCYVPLSPRIINKPDKFTSAKTKENEKPSS